jgi:hypothetical protein
MKIKFIAEYTDGVYTFLALETGDHPTGYCSEQGCMNTPNSTLYDVEGDPMLFCAYHIQRLDQDDEMGWKRGRTIYPVDADGVEECSTPAQIVAEWIINNPEMFVEVVPIPFKEIVAEDEKREGMRDCKGRGPDHPQFDPEQAYNFS